MRRLRLLRFLLGWLRLRRLRLLWFLLGWLRLRLRRLRLLRLLWFWLILVGALVWSWYILIKILIWGRLRFTTGAIGVADTNLGAFFDLTGWVQCQHGAGGFCVVALNTFNRKAQLFKLVGNFINIPTQVIVRVDRNGGNSLGRFGLRFLI